jgi:hypothetical protein
MAKTSDALKILDRLTGDDPALRTLIQSEFSDEVNAKIMKYWYRVEKIAACKYRKNPHWAWDESDLAQEGFFGLRKHALNGTVGLGAGLFLVHHCMNRFMLENQNMIRWKCKHAKRMLPKQHKKLKNMNMNDAFRPSTGDEAPVVFLSQKELEKIPTKESQVLDPDIVSALYQAVDKLPINRAEVVKAVFGLGGQRPRSYRSIATEQGKTVSWISYLVNDSLRKLHRQPKLNEVLKEYKR